MRTSTVADVNLADIYPELDGGQDRRRLILPTQTLVHGRWSPAGGTAGVGWVVADGVLLRRVAIGKGACSELIGRGDVIRPWEVEEGEGSIETAVDWRVIEPARLCRIAARPDQLAPSVLEVVAAHSLSRIQRLTVQVAIAAQVGVERRVLLMLNHLADRWGRVRPDGVLLPIRLSHATLAQLVCARRPTVSTAIAHLTGEAAVSRLPGGAWLLSRSASAVR